MANYTTLLKTWGDTGSEYPSGYSYLEGEQPVDAWDNFLIYNVVDDLDSLIDLTNERIETDKGTSLPGSPEDSHIFSDEDDGSLHYYDLSTTSWHRLLAADGDTMAGVLDMGGYQIEDATGSLTLAGAVEAPNGSFSVGGNSVLTTGDEGSGNGINADQVDGKHASELGLVVEEDGSVLVSPATAIDFTGHLKVIDDTDGTVTIDPTHGHSHSELSGVGSSDHHTKYTDAEARSAIESGDVSKVEGDGGLTLVFDSSNNRFEFEDSANNRTEGLFSRVYLQDGAGWFEGSHGDLTNVNSNDHHSRYADSEAVSAVNSEASLSVDITGDADTLDGNHASAFATSSDISNHSNDSNAHHNKYSPTVEASGTVVLNASNTHTSPGVKIQSGYDNNSYYGSTAYGIGSGDSTAVVYTPNVGTGRRTMTYEKNSTQNNGGNPEFGYEVVSL